MRRKSTVSQVSALALIAAIFVGFFPAEARAQLPGQLSGAEVAKSTIVGTERIVFAGTIMASEPIKFINLVPVRTASGPSQDAPPPDGRGVIRIPVRVAGAFRWEGPDPGLVSLTFDGCPTNIELTPSGESTLALSRLVNGEIDKGSGMKTDSTGMKSPYNFSTSVTLSRTLIGGGVGFSLSSSGGVIVNPDPCADTQGARKPPVK